MGCVYKLTSPSGKSYIGITLKTLDERWSKHVEHAIGKRDAGALYAALRKYGTENFTKEILLEHDDWLTLCELEKIAIEAHNTRSPNGYNITTGGEGTQGPLSESARAKVSVAQKKRFQNPVQRALLIKWGDISRAKRKQEAVERRKAWRANQDAYLKSPEFKKLHSDATKRAMATPGVRAKVMEGAQKRASDPEWRAKISKAKTGKKVGPCSDLRKQRISEARKREWRDPIMRSKRLKAFRQHHENSQTKA